MFWGRETSVCPVILLTARLVVPFNTDMLFSLSMWITVDICVADENTSTLLLKLYKFSKTKIQNKNLNNKIRKKFFLKVFHSKLSKSKAEHLRTLCAAISFIHSLMNVTTNINIYINLMCCFGRYKVPPNNQHVAAHV